MAKELNKVYEPQAVEAEIYKMWQEGGYFHAERDVRVANLRKKLNLSEAIRTISKAGYRLEER